jgi:transposase InsO family protein
VQLCATAGVSRASWYRWRGRDAGSVPECALREQVQKTALRWPTYGSRRITHWLRRQGWKVNRKRIQRLMRLDNLLCLRHRRCWLGTTDSRHGLPLFPNLTKGLVITGINQLWVADITYIRLTRQFVYLAAILDAFSRRVIGWAVDSQLHAQLCVDALRQALQRRKPDDGLIHHSDQGAQYCSDEYRRLLATHHLRGSMARKGNPYDNALAESFWKTLKSEQVNRNDYQTLSQVRTSIRHFIEVVYNAQRLHSALGYRPPAEFEVLGRASRK